MGRGSPRTSTTTCMAVVAVALALVVLPLAVSALDCRPVSSYNSDGSGIFYSGRVDLVAPTYSGSKTITVPNTNTVKVSSADGLYVYVDLTGNVLTDFSVTLTHAGRTITLFEQIGGGSLNAIQAWFWDNGMSGNIQSVDGTWTSVIGNTVVGVGVTQFDFRPAESLAAFVNTDLAGDWTITATDGNGSNNLALTSSLRQWVLQYQDWCIFSPAQVSLVVGDASLAIGIQGIIPPSPTYPQVALQFFTDSSCRTPLSGEAAIPVGYTAGNPLLDSNTQLFQFTLTFNTLARTSAATQLNLCTNPGVNTGGYWMPVSGSPINILAPTVSPLSVPAGLIRSRVVIRAANLPDISGDASALILSSNGCTAPTAVSNTSITFASYDSNYIALYFATRAVVSGAVTFASPQVNIPLCARFTSTAEYVNIATMSIGDPNQPAPTGATPNAIPINVESLVHVFGQFFTEITSFSVVPLGSACATTNVVASALSGPLTTDTLVDSTVGLSSCSDQNYCRRFSFKLTVTQGKSLQVCYLLNDQATWAEVPNGVVTAGSTAVSAELVPADDAFTESQFASGTGVRTYEETVTFLSPFARVPDVIVGLSALGVVAPSDTRLYCSAVSITTIDMRCRCVTYGTTKINRFRVYVLAHYSPASLGRVSSTGNITFGSRGRADWERLPASVPASREQDESIGFPVDYASTPSIIVGLRHLWIFSETANAFSSKVTTASPRNFNFRAALLNDSRASRLAFSWFAFPSTTSSGQYALQGGQSFISTVSCNSHTFQTVLTTPAPQFVVFSLGWQIDSAMNSGLDFTLSVGTTGATSMQVCLASNSIGTITQIDYQWAVFGILA